MLIYSLVHQFVTECRDLQFDCNEPSDLEFDKLTWSMMLLLISYSYNDEVKRRWDSGWWQRRWDGGGGSMVVEVEVGWWLNCVNHCLIIISWLNHCLIIITLLNVSGNGGSGTKREKM